MREALGTCLSPQGGLNGGSGEPGDRSLPRAPPPPSQPSPEASSPPTAGTGSRGLCLRVHLGPPAFAKPDRPCPSPPGTGRGRCGVYRLSCLCPPPPHLALLGGLSPPETVYRVPSQPGHLWGQDSRTGVGPSSPLVPAQRVSLLLGRPSGLLTVQSSGWLGTDLDDQKIKPYRMIRLSCPVREPLLGCFVLLEGPGARGAGSVLPAPQLPAEGGNPLAVQWDHGVCLIPGAAVPRPGTLSKFLVSQLWRPEVRGRAWAGLAPGSPAVSSWLSRVPRLVGVWLQLRACTFRLLLSRSQAATPGAAPQPLC